MISKLLASTIAKTVAVAFVAAIFAASVAGASAAMGGPNVPARAVSALGLDGSQNGNVNDVNDADSDTPTPTPTATATTTPTSDVDATATAQTESFFGLCNAWSHGSDKGQANKQDAHGFAGLIAAAGSADKVAAFCETVAKPTETVSPGATPASGTATSTPHPGHGNGNGDSNGHPGGRP